MRSARSCGCWLGGGVILVVSGVAWAAVPLLKEDELKSRATHIVVGEIRAVYTAQDARKADFADWKHCVEVMPSAVEKGAGLKEGRLVYARTWEPARRPEQWTGHQGQNLTPRVGQRMRMYMAEAKDGGLDLLLPNGLEVVKEK